MKKRLEHTLTLWLVVYLAGLGGLVGLDLLLNEVFLRLTTEHLPKWTLVSAFIVPFAYLFYSQPNTPSANKPVRKSIYPLIPAIFVSAVTLIILVPFLFPSPERTVGMGGLAIVANLVFFSAILIPVNVVLWAFSLRKYFRNSKPRG